MIEARRRAYLEAMGFDVWVARSALQPDAVDGAAIPGLLVVGPGQGSTLLVCASAAETADKFAADVARSVGGDPAWAWPDRSGSAEGLTLESAIAARLITRVLIFGADTARCLFAGEVPEVVASAAVTTVDGLGELAARGAGKRALWRRLQDPLRGGPVSTLARAPT